MPPVLLIPGNMCDDRLWEPVAQVLHAAGHSVLHAPLLNQHTISAMADATASSLDGPVIAIGFSMGAIVAAEMARRWPLGVVGLGLIAFNASADLPDRAAVRPSQQNAARDGRLEAIVTNELKPNYLAAENRGDAALLAAVMHMARALGPETFIAQSEALRRRDDLRPALPQLTMPVMLACGSEDRLCPADWHRTWCDMIGPNARFTEIPGAGHLLPLEQPQALADVLLAWLATECLCQAAS